MDKLLAGYGETTITPPLGTELSGYGFYLERKAEAVLDDLHARTVFLRRGRTGLMIISCDLIGFSVEFADEMRRSLADEYGLPPANVLLACTHTHTGPASMVIEGAGQFEPGYPASLPGLIQAAVRRAVSDLAEAKFATGSEIIEPISYNRRTGSLEPIDPRLNVLVFKREKRSIYLLNYGCHAVTLGRLSSVSADWPGAVVGNLERLGHHGLFFQGFCGDMEPTTNRNRWGEADQEDLVLYGELLVRRALKAERFASTSEAPALNAVEERIRLPLAVPTPAELEKSRAAWLERSRKVDAAQKVIRSERIIEWWTESARKALAGALEKPFVENVPVQGVSIGGAKILALPGEVFCQYGLNLRRAEPNLATFGYANGNVGYLPTRSAYDTPFDYACYSAPRFYGFLFPFQPEIEEIILRTSRSVLSAL